MRFIQTYSQGLHHTDASICQDDYIMIIFKIAPSESYTFCVSGAREYALIYDLYVWNFSC